MKNKITGTIRSMKHTWMLWQKVKVCRHILCIIILVSSLGICKQDVNFEGFKAFFNLYLDAEAPDELCRHLFLSFVKRPSALLLPAPSTSPIPIPTSHTFPDGKAIQVRWIFFHPNFGLPLNMLKFNIIICEWDWLNSQNYADKINELLLHQIYEMNWFPRNIPTFLVVGCPWVIL